MPELYEARSVDQIRAVERLLSRVHSNADSNKAGEVMRLKYYLMENHCSLSDYRLEVDGEGLASLEAVASNVGKPTADSAKERRISPARRGADIVRRLIRLRAKQVDDWARCQSRLQHDSLVDRMRFKEFNFSIVTRCVAQRISAGLARFAPGLLVSAPVWTLAHSDMRP